MAFSLNKINIKAVALFFIVEMLCSCGKEHNSIYQPSDEPSAVSPLAQQFGFSKERPLVMGMNTSYAPLQYVDEQGVPCGYDVEFTKILMQRMGIPFTFSPNHWDKMSPGIIEGKYDMGMMVYSSYRKDITNYSNAVFRLYYQIAYRKADYKEFDFRNLSGKRIAYMKSRPIGLMLKDNNAIDVAVTDLSQAFVDLANGEYDGLICYRFQAKYNMDILRLQDVLATDELSLEPREYCYASHDSVLIDSINAELRRMEEEGIIDEVYGQDVVSQFDIITIPMWVWYLVTALIFIFLVVFGANRYFYSRRLQQAHQHLQQAYDQMAEKNDQLLLANARAEESTRMKSEFIKQISHEIRTPLNIMSGFVQILATPDVKLSDDEKTEISKQIVGNTERITSLVNKMIELSDVHSQVVLERTDSVSAAALAQEAVLESGITDASHVIFELRADASAEQPFNTNQRSAVRILELLLDNAMKFTRPAEALLGQSAVTEQKEHVTLTITESDGKARFVVEDTGKGIPEDEAEHIFDEFVQLDEYYDGTGIGLSVARSLARRLGGDVMFDKTYQNGARFVVTLAL